MRFHKRTVIIPAVPKPETYRRFWERYDLEFGIHSGFPPCCVEAYVRDHLRMRVASALLRPDRYEVRYVRCQLCIDNDLVGRVRPHLCGRRERPDCELWRRRRKTLRVAFNTYVALHPDSVEREVRFTGGSYY